MLVRPLLVAITLLAAACSGSSDPGGPGPDEDYSEYFEPGRLLRIDITIAEADWNQLRTQTRTLTDIFGGDCLAAPFGSPFTYFPASVTIDGESFGMVGLRKKGFLGSLSEEKPSLKIKFDEYVPDQSLQGMKLMTLNNSQQDPAYVRQCLGYDAFAQAGLPASRCNFAHVTLNGNDMGIFVHVESIKGPMLRRIFGSDTGNLYEGTLSDFRPEWENTFERKNNLSDPDVSDIRAITTALEKPDDELVAALEPLMDLDQFVRFWAAEVLIAHWDGYAGNTNNFYMYRDPADGKFRFIVWGIDGIMGRGNGADPLPIVYGTGVLAQRLYGIPEMRQRYAAEVQDLLDNVWDEEYFLAESARMRDLIAPYVDDPELESLVSEVQDFIRDRRAPLAEALASGFPDQNWTLRDPFCFEEIGDTSGTFSTTWGTITNDNPFATGTGTLMATIRGVPYQVGMVGARAGRDQEDPTRPVAQVQVFASLADGTIAVVILEVNDTQFQSGNTVPVGTGGNQAFVFRFNPDTGEGWLEALLSEGTITFTDAGLTGGAAVSGSFSGKLVSFPF